MLIAKYTGRIIFHVSASNWPTVFTRIRNKIHHLASTAEEVHDVVDIRLIAHSALDRTKLVMILQGELLRAFFSPGSHCAETRTLTTAFQSYLRCS
jgi:hypothetical protein